MIVCHIEVWPFGDESKKRSVGRVEIGNVGGDEQRGDYQVKLFKSPAYTKSGAAEDAKKVWKRGFVENFPRLRLGPYDLLYRALRFSGIGVRNP